MLKKINTYLIENNPNIWHIRLPYLLLTGTIMHLFAFFYGYIYLDTNVLVNGNSYDYEFNSYFFLFEFILLLVIFFGWALQFYKNSVLKHYYKAKNSYAVKTFLVLCLLFFWNISSYLTFMVGIDTKRLDIIEKYNVYELVKEERFLSPLLLTSYNEYDLDYNNYISKNGISYTDIDSNATRINYCNEKDYHAHENKIEDCYTLIKDIDSSNFTTIRGQKALFFTKKSIKDEKGCSTEVIDKYYRLDHLEWNCLQNHPNYSTELDQLIKEKKYDVLAKRLEIFKTHLNSIYNFTSFDPWTNLSYIVKKNQLNLTDIYDYPASHTSFTPIHNTSINPDIDINYLESSDSYVFYFRSQGLDSFKYNAFHSPKYYEYFLSLLVFSICFAYFLIHFQFLNFINFAIAVPIGGVLLLFGVFFTLVLYGIMREYAALLYLILLLFLALAIFLGKKSMKERLKEVLLFFLSVLIPLTIIVVYMVIGLEIYQEKQLPDPCEYSFTPYSYFVAPRYYEWHFIVLGLASSCFYLWKIKDWKAKKE